ncbi:MAG: energy transducer TonB [Ferruginibacter sp.]
MKSENILKADLLDIVFDNRNKDYGAYELRKNYRRRLTKAILVSIVFAGAIGSLVFTTKGKKIIAAIPETEIIKIFDETPPNKPEAPKPKPKPEAPKAPEAAKPVPQQQFVSRVEITKHETEVGKIKELDPNIAIGGKNIEGEPQGHVIVDKPIKIDEGGEVIPETVDKVTPRATAEVMPSYPGGMAALRKFLEKNLQSPNDMEDGEIVSVKVKFIVGYDGKLKGFEIVENGGDAYNKEVIRVLKKMPEWIPGRANGENVSVYYTIPVKFTAVN